MRDGKAVAREDRPFELHSSLVVSSIGSLPEPLPGIVMKGTFYDYADWDTGAYAPVPGVFGVGNVVTGRGNIKASEHHAKDVAHWLTEHYLGVQATDDATIDRWPHAAAPRPARRRGDPGGRPTSRRRPLLPAAAADALIDRIRARQAEVGYDGYAAWMARVTPPDAE